jgi:uncharacterized membrane protein
MSCATPLAAGAIGSFVLNMMVWAAINSLVLGRSSFDPYPYILFNLFLSMLAGLQGAILLIAAKRQDTISAAMAQHKFDTNVAAETEIDRLLRLGQQHIEMLAELHALVKEISVTTTPSQTHTGSVAPPIKPGQAPARAQ